ncbi:MAG: Zn-dependent hydrolase, partial [Symploca sp. SIO2B6]|nr:Zn-dependent hydrolase [Symploca sp. SIO2B6]
GRPDVLLLPVGGGPKAYNPEQAQAAIAELNPKLVIPTQYLTDAADTEACDLVGVNAFISLMGEEAVTYLNSDIYQLSVGSLPTEEMKIVVFDR